MGFLFRRFMDIKKLPPLTLKLPQHGARYRVVEALEGDSHAPIVDMVHDSKCCPFCRATDCFNSAERISDELEKPERMADIKRK